MLSFEILEQTLGIYARKPDQSKGLIGSLLQRWSAYGLITNSLEEIRETLIQFSGWRSKNSKLERGTLSATGGVCNAQQMATLLEKCSQSFRERKFGSNLESLVNHHDREERRRRIFQNKIMWIVKSNHTQVGSTSVCKWGSFRPRKSCGINVSLRRDVQRANTPKATWIEPRCQQASIAPAELSPVSSQRLLCFRQEGFTPFSFYTGRDACIPFCQFYA